MKYSDSWKKILSHSFISPKTLLQQLNLDSLKLDSLLKADAHFRLQIPTPFLLRIKKGDPEDPLLLQVLPSEKELIKTPGYSVDPIKETQYIPYPGIIHKYHARVLLLISGACAINCRFCFRRHFPYRENLLNTEGITNAIKYISNDTSIKEVIFSGGDPLVCSDNRLEQIIMLIAKIPHVDIVRIHSRLPIVIPQRVTNKMLYWLTCTRLKPVLVIHCNHHQEIDNEVEKSIKKLHQSGITVLNQSTLLKGVNDSADTLIKLSYRLFSMQSLPYYLHQLDKVQGAEHFNVSDQHALNLIEEVTRKCPGYLVPKLVKEIPGQPNKTPLINNMKIVNSNNIKLKCL